MRINTLFLRQFRKLQERQFDFEPGLVALVGPNALGKTTVLEAIYFLITGRSFRTSRLQDLYQEGESRFDLACEYEKEGATDRVTVSVTPQRKEVAYSFQRSSNLSALLGHMVGSILTPDDDAFVKGAPEVRRRFLDFQILKTDPFYHWHLARYKRAMRQRNHLLKLGRFPLLSPWEEEMALSADYIVKRRREVLKELVPCFKEAYSRLQDSGETVDLKFITHDKENEGQAFYRAQWEQSRPREKLLGATLIGPHKDDLDLYIGKKAARSFASEGQKETLLLALKLAEWERLNRLIGEKPIFMIDDIGLSLDRERRKRLFSEMGHMGQVFLTTTDRENIPLRDPQFITF